MAGSVRGSTLSGSGRASCASEIPGESLEHDARSQIGPPREETRADVDATDPIDHPLLLLAALPVGAVFAQSSSSPAGNLRLVDESNVELTREPSDLADQIYRVPEGTSALNIAFDFSGSSPTAIQTRVLGNLGATLYQESETYDAPGSHVVTFDNKTPLEVGEYVVNIYVGDDVYLADSFQLLVGDEVVLPTPQDEGPAMEIPTPELGGAEAAAPAASATLETPTGTGEAPSGSPALLALAGLGMVLLLGIVLWAGRSAMRRS